ncbi:uncharacterized protein C8Q71DRAFT_208930 [Rhodofomes roseus]|uniref:Uncharacterized protein n=1 Tax=Rhodofomes roseus TaxID=34475 RepID=A0A4Y9XZQ6_9APHY|nr:uncharacterized protein C8Q71DRAFT_208930 [Rhodofomes roseus]KAH9842569.1 hypothetical protein C8Q71DRAFT_208930 [Rhodofomes roseus]TFY55636.1 hypothetical protein EVJ58_g8121 [Rhodofomes roseus]
MASIDNQPAHTDEHELGEHFTQHDGEPEGAQAAEANKPKTSPHILDLDLPQADFDLTSTFESILSEPQSRDEPAEVQLVQKRASNVFKLTQENEKLQAELRAMTARLEAAERRQQELAQRAAAARSQERSPPPS